MTKVTLRIDGQRSVDMVELGQQINADLAEFVDSTDRPSRLAPQVQAKLMAIFHDLVEGVGVESDTVFLRPFNHVPKDTGESIITWERDEGGDLVEAVHHELPASAGPKYWLIGARDRRRSNPTLVASYSYQQEPPAFVTRVWVRD